MVRTSRHGVLQLAFRAGRYLSNFMCAPWRRQGVRVYAGKVGPQALVQRAVARPGERRSRRPGLREHGVPAEQFASSVDAVAAPTQGAIAATSYDAATAEQYGVHEIHVNLEMNVANATHTTDTKISESMTDVMAKLAHVSRSAGSIVIEPEEEASSLIARCRVTSRGLYDVRRRALSH